jgi:two-component system NtrC family response regulator
MFRINTFEIALPPLRDRVSDIADLADHLFRRYRQCGDSHQGFFTAEAIEALQSHVWPGNVRELANVIEHATILCDAPPISVEHLPRRLTDARASSVYHRQLGPMTLRELEIQAIQESLERHDGSKPAAAEELGISLKTLYNKLNQASNLEKSA